MLNTLAIAMIAIIAIMFVVISVVCFFCSDNAKHKSKRTVIIGICVLFILFLFFRVIFFRLNDKYITTPEMSTIEIKDIYFDGYVYSNTLRQAYIILDANDNLYSIETDNICKGDGNYLITYTQPKLTPNISSLIGHDKYEYQIVLTNPEDIDKLSTKHK